MLGLAKHVVAQIFETQMPFKGAQRAFRSFRVYFLGQQRHIGDARVIVLRVYSRKKKPVFVHHVTLFVCFARLVRSDPERQTPLAGHDSILLCQPCF